MSDNYSTPVLGIDLGASYTKVAYRPGWNRGRYYEEPCRILMIEDQPLVPSLVIHTDSKRKPWLFGQEAAQYRPTDEDQVFTNWKADIFSKSLTPKAVGSLKAAGEFFGWLRERVADCGIEVPNCRVKVCLPAFRDIERPASILAQQMKLSGWNNVSISRIAEPRANTVGVFAEGRNKLYKRDANFDANPIYMDMYPHGSPLLDQLRSYTLSGGSRHSNIAIIDIGSFTTDLSVVDFDAAADGDCIASAHQTSYDLGIIGAFEQPLLSAISERHEFELNSLTFEEREAIKRAIAEGGKFVLPLDDDRMAEIGDEEDQKTANKIATDLAIGVWEAYQAETARMKVRYLVLTGGGSAAQLICKALQAKFAKTKLPWVDVSGMESPEGGKKKTCRRWPDTGETLSRLATALGAASVILDLPSGEPLPEKVNRKPVVYPYATCACQGKNKDCMTCGGRGEYDTRAIE